MVVNAGSREASPFTTVCHCARHYIPIRKPPPAMHVERRENPGTTERTSTETDADGAGPHTPSIAAEHYVAPSTVTLPALPPTQPTAPTQLKGNVGPVMSSNFDEEETNLQEAVSLKDATHLAEEVELTGEAKVEDKLSAGKLKYGCKHYRRRCRIRAPCCNEIFDCRHCHNEAKNTNEADDLKRHDIPRHRVERVICSLCDHEQDVKQVCENCGVCMGDYYCDKCKFFDDETEKEQYHCDACGICRIGGRENFFHCDRCGSCYTIALQNSHPCVENAMHQNCPVCVEYLFDSVMDISVLPCGHTMHRACLRQMTLHSQFCCPICSKSIQDMSRFWEILDQEIYLTPMPEEYRHKKVWVLCNDCGRTSNVNYHVIGHKCSGCGSYNTRSTCKPAESRSGSIESSMSSTVGSLPGQMGRAIAPEMLAE